ncbi:MBL fold metallo-hydrolase [Nocardioides panzhihuensis]|uniref:Ribonuclease BN (tRNA processing enzyme) n=1 Tax=Nocardioides panzhihuensis TaxID=860243 RepID=A0A7Z0DI75_9ACTN|nr:MBL fold metallo-hydrolase [Nocardioides panzhihuensis]NYI75807.1 ribonuclease BN (tRNA processing enzyme) [Nocardioides panzhihuensis]
MRVTVIGGQGAWPTQEAGCSGYLVEAAGQKILVDPGWATFQALTRLVAPTDIDTVLVSHSHPDHCADLLPLLRARALSAPAADPLPVYAPAGALDNLLASDAVGAVQRAAELMDVVDGSSMRIGAVDVTFAELPHHVTNLGMRLSDGATTVSYTGDGGPDAAVAELAAAADLHIAEATYPDPITDEDAGLLTDVASAIEQGTAAGARHILLTHLWPGLSYDHLIHDRRRETLPTLSVASPGFTWEPFA